MRVVAIVVLSTAVLSVAPRSKRATRAMFVLGVVAAAMMLVLIDGPIARWISMLIGVPSIASIAWLADVACARAFDRPLFATNERRALLSAMAVLSLVLYPSALGYVNIDMYRLGFTPVAPLLVGVIAIALAFRREFRLALLLFAVLLMLDVQLLPSNNVFDYAIDPVGGLCAVGWAAVRVARWVSARTLMRVRSGVFDAKQSPGPERGRPAPEGSPV